MSFLWSRVLALAAVSTVSCAGGRSVDDGGSPAAQRDGALVEPPGATAIPGPLPVCTDPVGSCPATSFAIWQVLLDAAKLGESARFIATGGQAVVVSDGGGAYRVARIRDFGIPEDKAPPFSSRTIDAGGLQPIAVAEAHSGVSTTTTFVLACDEEGARCALLRAADSDPAFLPWPEGALPAGFSPRGLEVDDTAQPELLCVFGNGLLCFNEGWVEAIAPSTDLELNDVALGGNWSVAVGDGGRWFRRERLASGDLGDWQEQLPIGGVELAQASVNRWGSPTGAVIVGDGQLRAALGEQREWFGCSPRDDLVALMLDGVRASAYVVASTGEVFLHAQTRPGRFEPYCAYQQLPPWGPVLDTGTAPCQDALNPRVLTEHALYGMNVCLLLSDS